MKNILLKTLICFTILLGCNNSKKNETITDNDNQKTSKPIEVVDTFPKFSNTPTSDKIRQTSDSIVKKIDATIPKMTKEEKKIKIYGTPNTPVTIWYSNSNTPVKIVHSVANESGEFKDKFQYYFIDGKLWYSDQVFARYIFDNTNLKYWLDENWRINDIPENNFKEREKTIEENINKLLLENN